MSEKKMYFTGNDMLLLADGSTYHLGCKQGQVHNRILTVGSRARAAELSKLLDGPVAEYHSSRDMSVYSGTFEGKNISIIAIGMGAPMMNFMTREVSFIVPGPLAIVRLGTCGILDPYVKPGTVICTSEGSLYVQTNYNHRMDILEKGESSEPPYLISRLVPCDRRLSSLLKIELMNSKLPTCSGINASAELFYSCQGRYSDGFEDFNKGILDELMAKRVLSFEMETHQLLYEAQIRKAPCYAAACAIGILNRANPEMTNTISAEELHRLEKSAGLAALKALCKLVL